MNHSALDRHITGNYGADQYNGSDERYDAVIDARVIVEDESYTVEDYELWIDEDEDGKHDGVDFLLVYFYERSDGSTGKSTRMVSMETLIEGLEAYRDHIAEAPGPMGHAITQINAVIKEIS